MPVCMFAQCLCTGLAEPLQTFSGKLALKKPEVKEGGTGGQKGTCVCLGLETDPSNPRGAGMADGRGLDSYAILSLSLEH